MKRIFIFLNLLVFIMLFALTSFCKVRAPFQRPFPFALEILKGNVPGHSLVTVNGHNPAVGTTTETLWLEGGLVVFPSSASIMTLSSSDVDDTSAGTGLRTVLVTGLNAGVELSEIVVLNGQTGVTTVNSYDRINFLEGLTAGATASNEGIIYIGTGSITTGKPAAVVNLIGVNNNLSDSGFFSVPNNKTAYLFQLFASAEGLKVITLESFVRKINGLFLLVTEFNLFNAIFPVTEMAPTNIMPPRSDIEFRGRIDAGSGDVKTTCVFILVDNSVL